MIITSILGAKNNGKTSFLLKFKQLTQFDREGRMKASTPNIKNYLIFNL